MRFDHSASEFTCYISVQSVRVIFEIGHNAVVRSKSTPEGFTHDWELFIRGADNTDIQHFVDKVVFYLHESFTNPKRGEHLIPRYFKPSSSSKLMKFPFQLSKNPRITSVNRAMRDFRYSSTYT